MPNFSLPQLELIADACAFYFMYISRLSIGATAAEFEHLAERADALAEISDLARDAAEVQ